MAWLILDSTYLCHRSFYSTGGGSGVGMGEGLDNGVMYGFLRDIVTLQEEHRADGMVFCFDEGVSKRKEIYPDYKGHRQYKERDFLNRRKEFSRQIRMLVEYALPGLGFKNVVSKDGYEGDDLVASACLHSKWECVVVGSDKDFYQLLSEKVCIWKPKEKVLYTEHSLREEYGVHPSQWARVKAIAGCATDNVPGVRGVGEKTAARYVLGKLPDNTLAYKNIKGQWPLVVRNMDLVRLPLEGTPPVVPVKDVIEPGKWRKVMSDLGMKSLIGRCPIFC